MTEQIDLLSLSVLARDAVLNSMPEHPITTFETTKIEIDGHPNGKVLGGSSHENYRQRR